MNVVGHCWSGKRRRIGSTGGRRVLPRVARYDAMSSKTRMLRLVKGLRWRELKAEIREDGRFLGIEDEKGRNLLHLCCSVNAREKGMKERDGVRTADVLLDAGIDINGAAFGEGDWKATPLWFAVAFSDSLALARHLLRRGSTPRYCMWAAVNRDNGAAIRLLVKNGADDPTNEQGSPLLAAVNWNKPAAAAELLKLGADVNYQDGDGRTPLHIALRKRRDKSLVELLVDHGARGDIKDGKGETAGELMRRRRDPAFREMARRLRVGS